MKNIGEELVQDVGRESNLHKKIQEADAERFVTKLVETLVSESVCFEDKCTVMAHMHQLLRNTCCNVGYDIALNTVIATTNITHESPNLAMFARLSHHVLMKNVAHTSGFFPQVVLSLLEANQSYCDEELKQNTLFAIWNNQELLVLPLEVLELMALRWKFGLEVQCLQMYHNKEGVPDHLIKLCTSSPTIFQACLSILSQFLIENNGHQQVRRLFTDLIESVAITCPMLWKLFPLRYQKLALFLQVDPDIYPKESTAGVSQDFVLGLLTELFCNTKNNNSIPGLIMISCFPKWLPHLVVFHKQKYKTSFFPVLTI